MVVLLSPSKTFSNSKLKGSSKPYFINKTKVLLNKLKELNKDEIKDIFKVSDKLAEVVFNYYNNETLVSAISLYQGEVFKALNYENLTFKDNKLYILSALYGVLRPFDSISKYRLDFNIKAFGNLYNYWSEDVSNYFKNNYQEDFIVDLSSNEFSKLLVNLDNVYKVNFKDNNNKRLSSVLLKQLRGYFANIIINKNIKSIDGLKDLNVEGFIYDEDKSSKKTIIFSK